MRKPGLFIFELSSSRERAVHLEKFDGRDSTWIVADVRSKLAIQRRLLEKTGFADGLAVVRASELWSHALRRLEPDLQIVSRELIQASIASRLERRDEIWLKAPGAAKTAFEYIKQLLPILALSAANGEAAGVSFDDWFEQPDNLSMKERWHDWYQIAHVVWNSLRDDRLCAASWVPGALATVKESLATVIDRN